MKTQTQMINNIKISIIVADKRMKIKDTDILKIKDFFRARAFESKFTFKDATYDAKIFPSIFKNDKQRWITISIKLKLDKKSLKLNTLYLHQLSKNWKLTRIETYADELEIVFASNADDLQIVFGSN